MARQLGGSIMTLAGVTRPLLFSTGTINIVGESVPTAPYARVIWMGLVTGYTTLQTLLPPEFRLRRQHDRRTRALGLQFLDNLRSLTHVLLLICWGSPASSSIPHASRVDNRLIHLSRALVAACCPFTASHSARSNLAIRSSCQSHNSQLPWSCDEGSSGGSASARSWQSAHWRLTHAAVTWCIRTHQSAKSRRNGLVRGTISSSSMFQL